MKVYCSTCTTNFTEIPDDVGLSPDFHFTCKECLPKADAVGARRLDTAHDPRLARRRHKPDDEGTSIEVEAFLSKIRTIAKSFASQYELDLEDCISEGTIGLLDAASTVTRSGKTLTGKYAAAAVRRAIFKFAAKELAERGKVRKTDSETGRKKWVNLRNVTSIDEKFETADYDGYSSLLSLHEAVSSAVDSPEDEAIKAETRGRVKGAVGKLPALWRKVLHLIFEKGLTVRQAAFVLRMSKSEVGRISSAATDEVSKNLGTKNPENAYDILGKTHTYGAAELKKAA